MSGHPRVLHLLDTDQFAGTERHVILLLTELAHLGVRSILGCRGGTPLCDVATRHGLCTMTPYDNAGALAALRSLVRLVRANEIDNEINNKIDLVHSHNGRTMLMGAALHRITGVRAVATQHFLAPQHTHYRGIKRLGANGAHAWVNGQMSHFIAVSEAARQAMIAREGVREERITTIPNGIAPLEMPEHAELMRVRGELGVAEQTPLVVTLARLATEKGLDYLLRAVSMVRAAVPEARFAIVGAGPQRAELVRLADELQVSGLVRFTGYREDATTLLAAADLFVLPSLAEPAGLALLEAMALRRPVVATHAGGPQEIVEDGVSGTLVPPADADALATAMVTLLRSPELRLRYAGKARERFCARYTAVEMARATASVYAKGGGS